MPFSFFNRSMAQRQQALGNRLPPGQYLTEKWPVLHYGGVPNADPKNWDFRIFGLVEEPVTLSYDEVMALPRKTVTADIHCVTRWTMLDSEWEGIPIADVLGLVKRKPAASHVLVHAEQGFTANLSLDDLLRDENLLVLKRNGEAISRDHGWPLRLFVPHLYFWKSVKWVRGFELLNRDEPGFWEQNGYHVRGDPWKEERYGW